MGNRHSIKIDRERRVWVRQRRQRPEHERSQNPYPSNGTVYADAIPKLTHKKRFEQNPFLSPQTPPSTYNPYQMGQSPYSSTPQRAMPQQQGIPPQLPTSPQMPMQPPAMQQPPMQQALPPQLPTSSQIPLQQPAMQQPAMQQTPMQQFPTQQSPMQQPPMQQPAMQQPTMQQPTMQQPSTQFPTTGMNADMGKALMQKT